MVNYLLFFCLFLDAYRLNLKHLKQPRQQVGSKLRCLFFCFLFLNFFFYIRGQFEKGNLNLKCCLKIDMFEKLNRVFSRGTKHDVNCLI